MGAVRRRCPETGGERAAQPEYASALGVGGKARAGLEAPSGPSRASASPSSQVLKQWLGLQVVRGTEAALEALTIGEDAEEFARVWDEAQQALAKNAVASVDSWSSGSARTRPLKRQAEIA